MNPTLDKERNETNVVIYFCLPCLARLMHCGKIGNQTTTRITLSLSHSLHFTDQKIEFVTFYVTCSLIINQRLGNTLEKVNSIPFHPSRDRPVSRMSECAFRVYHPFLSRLHVCRVPLTSLHIARVHPFGLCAPRVVTVIIYAGGI